MTQQFASGKSYTIFSDQTYHNALAPLSNSQTRVDGKEGNIIYAAEKSGNKYVTKEGILQL